MALEAGRDLLRGPSFSARVAQRPRARTAGPGRASCRCHRRRPPPQPPRCACCRCCRAARRAPPAAAAGRRPPLRLREIATAASTKEATHPSRTAGPPGRRPDPAWPLPARPDAEWVLPQLAAALRSSRRWRAEARWSWLELRAASRAAPRCALSMRCCGGGRLLGEVRCLPALTLPKTVAVLLPHSRRLLARRALLGARLLLARATSWQGAALCPAHRVFIVGSCSPSISATFYGSISATVLVRVWLKFGQTVSTIGWAKLKDRRSRLSLSSDSVRTMKGPSNFSPPCPGRQREAKCRGLPLKRLFFCSSFSSVAHSCFAGMCRSGCTSSWA